MERIKIQILDKYEVVDEISTIIKNHHDFLIFFLKY